MRERRRLGGTHGDHAAVVMEASVVTRIDDYVMTDKQRRGETAALLIMAHIRRRAVISPPCLVLALAVLTEAVEEVMPVA
jgi:hypothetical protein